MAHVVHAPAAEGLAQRFRNNDVRNDDTWTIDPQAWQSMRGWTAAQEGRNVAAAAALNTSIRNLHVIVSRQITDGAVDVLSTIVSQLRHVRAVRFDVEQRGGGGGNGGGGNNNVCPLPLVTLDNVAQAIAQCPSDVKDLACRTCFGLLGFHYLAKAFPNLEVLAVTGVLHPSHRCDVCGSADDFNLAFTTAVGEWLPRLRRVEIDATVPHPYNKGLLATLCASASLREIEIIVPAGRSDLVGAARIFCVKTQRVERFTVRGGDGGGGGGPLAAMSKIFDMGPMPSFAPTVTRVEFVRCEFRQTTVKRAIKALHFVESLRLGMCDFPSAMKVVGEGLPYLTQLSCVARDSVVGSTPYESMAERPYRATPHVLLANQDLEDVCLAVEREGSMLNDIELDLVSAAEGGESYPAIARLMGACRGRLVLNLGDFSGIPVGAQAHVVEGARRLHRDVNDLRLRFVNCQLEDRIVADLFRAFAASGTLAHLEVGLDARRLDLATAELSLAAMRGLIEANRKLQTLSIQGLRPDGATAILERIMPALAATNRSLRALALHGAAADLLSECLPRARTLALDALKKNDVLSTLEVGGETPGGDPVEALKRQNRYGRIFLRSNDPSPIGIWSAVLARISRNDEAGIMFKFLRAKPGLVRQQTSASGPSPRGRGGRKRGRGTKATVR